MDVDMSFTRAMDHYLGRVAPNRLRAETLRVATSTLKMWRRELGASTRLDAISRSHILTVRDNYAEPATANRVVSVLSSMLDACVEREWLDTNPCKRIRSLRVDNAETGKLITPEWEEILKTKAYEADINLYVLLCTAFETGARLGELERLTWAQVDLETRVITFLKTKNGTDRPVPISSWLAGVLVAHGLPGTLPRRTWNRVRAHLPEHVRFHDIRHTMISRALARGAPIATVGRLVGHKTLAMTLRYQHSDLADLRAIVESA